MRAGGWRSAGEQEGSRVPPSSRRAANIYIYWYHHYTCIITLGYIFSRSVLSRPAPRFLRFIFFVFEQFARAACSGLCARDAAAQQKPTLVPSIYPNYPNPN